MKYSTFDRELLAAFSTNCHFRFLLEDRQFQLLTDHKPLVTAMTRIMLLQSVRQQGHPAYISEFTTDLRHTSGSENVVADALSRPPAVMVVPAEGLPVLSIPPLISPSEPTWRTALPVPAAYVQPINFLELSFAQPSCPDVQVMLVSPSFLHWCFLTALARLLQVRCRSGASQHPSSRCQRRLVYANFCWPKMGVFVSALVFCFSHIYIDLVGPLPCSSVFSYLSTVVDRTTCWL